MEDIKKLIQKGYNLHKAGDVYTAIDYYKKALTYTNNDANLFFLIGTGNFQINNFQEAINFFRKTILLDPNNFGAYNNLGGALQSLKRYKDAINTYKKLLTIKPDFAGAYNNIGNCYFLLNKYEKAFENFQKSLEINKKDFVAYSNIGNVYKELGLNNKAINFYQKSIELNDKYLIAYNNLGTISQEMSLYHTASNNFERIYRINPDHKYVLGKLIHSKMYLSDWDKLNEQINNLTSKILERKKIALPYSILNIIDDPHLQLLTSEIFRNEKIISGKKNLVKNIRKRKKYKIGYFSPDFRNHPVLHLIKDVFKNHDKSKFEIYAFSFEPKKNDRMTNEIKKYFTKFIEVKNMSNDDISDVSNTIGLDIGVDLCGYTAFNRAEIFAKRVAPIQLNYLGYPGTLGPNFLDYIIADKTVIPKEEKENYSEEVIYLPECYQPNSQYEILKKRKLERKDFNLPENKVVYCNFGSNHKITPQMFNSWTEILKKVPDSVLWLIKPNEKAILNIMNEVKKKDIERERIIFADRLSHKPHLDRLRLADIFLDTFPYNAHTTASDAIRMGIPLISLQGRSFASRVSSSILKQVKMHKLIANSFGEFEKISIQLGNNKNEINDIKNELERNCIKSPLFKIDKFTKELENVFVSLIEKNLN